MPCQAKEWHLEQESNTFGQHSVFINSSGARCVNKKTGYTFVCQAPQWQVIVYNPNTKTFLTEPLDSFGGQMTLLFMANVSKASLIGLHFDNRGYLRQRGIQLRHFATAAGLTNEDCYRATIDTIVDATIAPQVGKFLAKLYRLPDLKEAPFQAQYENLHHGLRDALKTDTCFQQAVSISFADAALYKPDLSSKHFWHSADDNIDVGDFMHYMDAKRR